MYLAMTMAVKRRYPAETAEPRATRSAQTHSGYDAFSMLQPARNKIKSNLCKSSSDKTLL